MAVRLGPGHFEAHHLLGALLLEGGEADEAVVLLERAVALRPGSAPAEADLAACYVAQGLPGPAIAAYRRAAALAPRLGDVQARLGGLLQEHGRMAEASVCFDRAAAATADAALARIYRSDAALLRGDHEAAERRARQAVALAGASAAAHGTLAGVLYGRGQFAAAAASFETALRLDPTLAACWEGLVRCRNHAAPDDALVSRLRDVLGRRDLDDLARTRLHFALGKVFDDAGAYPEAWAQFAAGNRLRGQGLALDRASLEALVDRTMAWFTPGRLARQVAMGAADELPVFIVGMYRSGTTLVEQIASRHPAVAAGGELTLWEPAALEIDPATGEFDGARAAAAMRPYLAALRAIGPGAARVTDKLPTNFFRLGAIHAMLPRARIVHCRRDPVDTCLSIHTTLFGARMPFAADQDDLVFYYRQYARLMAHWRAVLPDGAFLDVSYERLVADREAETRRLIAFMGLAWDERCLAPELNTRAIGTASAWQARQPVYANSVGRWRNYAPWLDELRALDGIG